MYLNQAHSYYTIVLFRSLPWLIALLIQVSVIKTVGSKLTLLDDPHENHQQCQKNIILQKSFRRLRRHHQHHIWSGTGSTEVNPVFVLLSRGSPLVV